VVPEGSQLVAVDDISQPPVPMLGFVTSSYQSAALGRPFALALLADGFDRIGSTINAVVDHQLVSVDVTSHVLFDPEGARRDG
jgi:sarcosine oxidase subunit alpha